MHRKWHVNKITVSPMAKPSGDGIVVNCCSNSPLSWQRRLSPFFLGPVELYGGEVAQNVENAWQRTKVYQEHVDENNDPTDAYWSWAFDGWDDRRAVRYPMGKGRFPLYSFWDGQKLDYVAARKVIYVPLYAKAVLATDNFRWLKEFVQRKPVVLKDFDGYDEVAEGMTLTEVLNCPSKKMGHSFVLKMLLLNDDALKECGINVD